MCFLNLVMSYFKYFMFYTRTGDQALYFGGYTTAQLLNNPELPTPCVFFTYQQITIKFISSCPFHNRTMFVGLRIYTFTAASMSVCTNKFAMSYFMPYSEAVE